MEHEELRTLAAEAATGDLTAAEKLFYAVHDHLFAFLHLLGIPPRDLEDVAQNVVLRMYRSLPGYDPMRPFMPWFKSIALHVRADYWRKQKRRQGKMESFREYVAQQAERRPECGAWLSVDKTSLTRCIERLQQRARNIVELRYRQGLNSEVIGQQLGLTAQTVRKQLSRAREFLHKCITSPETSAA